MTVVSAAAECKMQDDMALRGRWTVLQPWENKEIYKRLPSPVERICIFHPLQALQPRSPVTHFYLSTSRPLEQTTAIIMNLLEALQNDREKENLAKAICDRQKRETDAVNKACLTELTEKIPEVRNPSLPCRTTTTFWNADLCTTRTSTTRGSGFAGFCVFSTNP